MTQFYITNPDRLDDRELFTAEEQCLMETALVQSCSQVFGDASWDHVEDLGKLNALETSVVPICKALGVPIAAGTDSTKSKWADVGAAIRMRMHLPILESAIAMDKLEVEEAQHFERRHRPERVPAAKRRRVASNLKLNITSPAGWTLLSKGEGDALFTAPNPKNPHGLGTYTLRVALAHDGDNDDNSEGGGRPLSVTVNTQLPDTHNTPTRTTTEDGWQNIAADLLASPCPGAMGLRDGSFPIPRHSNSSDAPQLARAVAAQPQPKIFCGHRLNPTFRHLNCTGIAQAKGGRCEFCAPPGGKTVRSKVQDLMRNLPKAGEPGTPSKFKPLTYYSKGDAVAAVKSERRKNVTLRARMKKIARRMRNCPAESMEVKTEEDVAAMDAIFLLANDVVAQPPDAVGACDDPKDVKSKSPAGKQPVQASDVPMVKTAIETMFAEGSPEKYVWDDIISNIVKRGEGKGKKSFRFHATTIRVALAILAKAGSSAYQELAGLMCLPSYRTLTTYKSGGTALQAGVIYDAFDYINEKITLAVAKEASDPAIPKTSRVGRAGMALGCLSMDAMEAKGKWLWSPHHGRFYGGTEMDTDLDVIQKEFTRAVQNADKQVIAGEVTTATKYQVFYWTSLGCKQLSFPICKVPMATCNASDLDNIIRDISVGAQFAGLQINAIVADGAGDNRSLFRCLGTLPASRFLTEAQQSTIRAGIAKSTTNDGEAEDGHEPQIAELLNFKVAGVLPGRPPHTDSCADDCKCEIVFFLSDPPHLWKKLAVALFKSNFKKTRDLQKPVKRSGCWTFDTLRLKMLETAYTEAEVGSGPRRWTRFSRAVFEKDKFNSMVVRYAVQAMSSTMLEIVKMCETLKLEPVFSEIRFYKSLLEMVEVVDKAVDAFNGRVDDRHKCGPIKMGKDGVVDSDQGHLRPVMDLLIFFGKWRSDLLVHATELDIDADMIKKHFLPKECWTDMQQSCLGLMCMANHYLKMYPNLRLWARNLCQDVRCQFFLHKFIIELPI